MTRTELNKIYSNIIASYINNGYEIATEHMSGSQGEICKTLLKNKTELICVLFDRHREKTEPGKLSFNDIFEISVGRYKRVAPTVCNYTIWLNDFDYFENHIYYPLCDAFESDLTKQWFVTKEEYEQLRAKRDERYIKKYENNYNHIFCNTRREFNNVPDTVKNHVRSIWGFKRVKDNEIKVIKKDTYGSIYSVYAKGKLVYNVM